MDTPAVFEVKFELTGDEFPDPRGMRSFQFRIIGLEHQAITDLQHMDFEQYRKFEDELKKRFGDQVTLHNIRAGKEIDKHRELTGRDLPLLVNRAAVDGMPFEEVERLFNEAALASEP